MPQKIKIQCNAYLEDYEFFRELQLTFRGKYLYAADAFKALVDAYKEMEEQKK